MRNTKTQSVRVNEGSSALRRFLRESVFLVAEIDPLAVNGISDEVIRIGGPAWHESNNPAFRILSERMMAEIMPIGNSFEGMQEFRLNRAGFKLYASFNGRDGLRAYVWGDQAKDHPDAYLMLTMVLKREGLLDERRCDGGWEPMSPGWLIANWTDLQLSTRAWVLSNLALLPKPVQDWFKVDLKS